MSRDHETLKRRLEAYHEDARPPADLLARLKADVPRELPVPANAETTAPGAPWRGQWWKLAAAVVLLVGAGFLTARLLPDLEPPAAERAAPAAEPEETEEKAAAGERAADEVMQEARQEDLEGAASMAAAPAPVPAPPEPQAMLQEAPPAAKKRIEARRQAEADAAFDIPEAMEAVPPPPPAVPAPRQTRERLAVPLEEMESLPISRSHRANVHLTERSLEIVSEPEPEAPLATYREEIQVTGEAPVVAVTSAITGQLIDAEQREESLPPSAIAQDREFTDPRGDRLSTFALEVDTGSYTLGRRYLTERGSMPPAELVRVEEWVNAFDYGDPAPASGTFTMAVEGAPSPLKNEPERYLVRLGLKAREIGPDERKPAALTFVVDVSGSMDQPDRLPLVKDSLAMLLDQLAPEDSVALVVYGDRGQVVLPHTRDKEAIRAAVRGLASQGSTNAEEGLRVGYEEAARGFLPNGLNRVLLLSDGVANVGRTGPEEILEQVAEQAGRGIELTTLGFGMGDYSDHMMEQLANRGDGRYAYVDSRKEAHRVLVEELTGTLATVAEETRTQVEWNPAAVARYRLLGYENRQIADREFRFFDTDAGEIGAGHAVTALFEVVLRKDVPPGRTLAVWRVRYRDPDDGGWIEESRNLTRADFAASWDDSPPALRLAGLVAWTAEVLAHAPGSSLSELPGLHRRLEALVAERWPADPRKTELVSLVGQAARAAERRLE